MSLNQISQSNTAILPDGRIDGLFKSLKASTFEVDQLTIDGSLQAQAILTDQLAVAGTLYPLTQATDKNLVIESNSINDLEYTKYNLLGVNNPTFVSVPNNTPTEVVGPSTTDFNGSYNIEFLKDLQTYKFTAQCRFITPNAGNLSFSPKIGGVNLFSIQTPIPVNNVTQQMTFEIIFSILSGAGTASTQISHSSSMVWNNGGGFTVLNKIGTNGTGPIDTSTPQGTAPSIELTYSTTGLDVNIDSYSLNRIY
jgi:hypothetical protein